MGMLRLIAALAISTLAACGGTGTAGGNGGSGGGGGGGGGGASGGASEPTALCTNPPANSAPQITAAYTAAPFSAAAATGGTLESGTYYMTAITYYENGSGSGTHKDTMVLDAASGTFAVVEVFSGTAKPTGAGTLTPSGATLSQTFVCPASMTATVQYTATPGMLTVYQPQAKSVSVWAKQ
jgi:hypothetical protein